MNNYKLRENISMEHLSESQMMRYNEGKMKAHEMHQVEMHVIQCEFCKDALEGFSFLPSKENADTLTEIKASFAKKLAKGNGNATNSKYLYWSIAASVLLLLSFGLFFLLKEGIQKEKEIISLNTEKEQSVKKEELSAQREKLNDSDKSELDETAAKDNAPKVNRENSQRKLSIAKSEEFTNKDNFEEEIEEPRKHISGKITDDQGRPLPGTTIKINGSETTTMADLNGNFSINVPVTSDSITFSAFGYKSSSIAYSPEKSTINPKLQFDPSSLTQITLAETSDPGEKKVTSSPAAREITTGKLKNTVTNWEVSGRVMGSDGSPLPGVNVVVKGTNIGTNTDINGNYSLSTPSSKSNLVFSSIGYVNTEVALNEQKNKADVTMNMDMQALSEVVTIGYGTQNGENVKSTIVVPKPIIGETEFKKYIKEKIKYTEAAKEKKVKGSVVLDFFVETDGTLTDFQIKKSLGYGLDEEAIKIIKEGPSWNPGSNNGAVERQKVTVKVPFKVK